VTATAAIGRETEYEPLPLSFRLDRKRSVSDQVYDALKGAIVSVRLMPGASISENRICRHLGVSRTPVRTAIVRLAEEGLIDVYPQQGSFVAPIRLAGAAEARFVRRVLEVAILREAAAIWTPELSAEARAIVACQEVAGAAGNVDRFHAEDARFHQAFCGFVGRPGVWDAIMHSAARLIRVVRLFGYAERMPQVIAEHLAMLDALDAGLVDQAVHRLEYHLDRIFEMIEQDPDAYRSYIAD
jgi:GntR family transcriptional regulator, rspAB operon transcriptional repressor